ncbi:hypothetical protein ACIBO2_26185 [Nonomuraea sp. NPDC050022]|uniref:hypothetical protein n=1 Tax=Nonomuraea sp. NPDC050022 TaxID=3364358 RepID=UPI0037A3AA18
MYFEWKASVIAAIAADLDGAARLFRDLVPEQERPDLDDYRPRARAASSRPRRSRLIPGAGKKRKPDKTDFAAAALAERMSVRQVAEVLKLTRMTAWRRIQNGRTGHADLLLKMRTVSRGGPIEMPSSSALPAGKLREPTLSQVTPTMGVTPTVVGQSPTVGGGQ